MNWRIFREARNDSTMKGLAYKRRVLTPTLDSRDDDPALLAALARHLELQIESGRRLLDQVLRQGAAIRERDAEAVLARLADIKGEMAARETLERDRGALIDDVALRLGIAPSK